MPTLAMVLAAAGSRLAKSADSRAGGVRPVCGSPGRSSEHAAAAAHNALPPTENATAALLSCARSPISREVTGLLPVKM